MSVQNAVEQTVSAVLPVKGTSSVSNNALTERIQIIDEDKKFTTELTTQIGKWGLRDAGFNYNIVAVFGSQSTGKSTLLNALFGTTFDVMDETQRRQTTKGIWMCRGKGMNVLVMDVEGTDGRERGEDQDFERKSALFSLASSEILIVNLWEHQVGLYQGANMGLLKTVFEVNLGLFGSKRDGTKTLLLFVIRDHIGHTPLANLQATLKQDLLKMWDSISKPTELASAQLSDYFDMTFIGLPHKILAPEKFTAEVQQLRTQFADKSKSNYLFDTKYHKRIPADGVAFYMDNIWEQVQSNKDLDLPTQQELLAQFRCDEISAVALSEFIEQAKSQKRPVEAGTVIKALGALMRQWREDTLVRFDRDASRYHQGVYKRKRAELTASIDTYLSPLYLGQLKNLHKLCLTSFKEEILAATKGENYDFAEVVSKSQTKWEDTFAVGAKEATVEGTDWVWEDELQLLKEEIGLVADQCRRDETKKMINLIERNFKKQISEPVDIILGKGEPDMWDRILILFRERIEKTEAAYLSKARSFNCTEHENEVALKALRQRSWLALRAKIDENTAEPTMIARLRAHFEEHFRYDAEGIPRVWRPDDDIDGAFKKAKESTLALIPLYAKINPTDPSLAYTLPSDAADDFLSDSQDVFDFESTLLVFSEAKLADLIQKFRRSADAYYVEAKRSTVSSIAQIPVWMYGVLVILGWNEAMVILFNPIYFALLVVALASAYATIQLGMVGPLFQVTKTVTGEVQKQITLRLREHFSQPTLTEPVAVRVKEEPRDDDAPVRIKQESKAYEL